MSFSDGLDEIPLSMWKECQTKLLDEIIRDQCMLLDEVDNFDDYLSEMMNLFKNKIYAQYIEKNNDKPTKKVYEFSIVDVFATSPYVPDYGGIDTPDSAILRANYESNVFGCVKLTIYEKPNENLIVPETKLEEKQKDDDVDEEDGDENDDDIEEEEEEEEEDVISLIDVDEEHSEVEEAHEEIQDDDEVDDLQEVLDGQASDVKAENENDCVGKRDREGSMLYERKQCFGYMYTSSKKDAVKIFERKSTHLIGKIPIFVRSEMCWLRQQFGFSKTSLYRPEFAGAAYIVSRHLQISDMDEYYVNNRPLLIADNEVQVRSQFFNPDKIYRTNNTLKVQLNVRRKRLKKVKRNNSKKNVDLKWLHKYDFVVIVPYVKTAQKVISVSILVMAFGWTIEQFVAALNIRFTADEFQFLEEELSFFFDVLRNGCIRKSSRTGEIVRIETQSDAMYEMGLSYLKFGQLQTREEKLSFLSRQLRQEYLPSLIDPSKEMTEEDSHSIDYVSENSQKCWILVDVVAMLIRQSDIVRQKQRLHNVEEIKMFDKNSYVNKRHHSAGYKLTALLRKMMKNTCSLLHNKLKSQVEKGRLKIHELVDIVYNMSITKHVIRGEWNTDKRTARDEEKGKTQMMTTGYNAVDVISQVQRMKKYGNPQNPQTDAFGTHPTYDGRWDPYFTPESRKKVGVTWYKALGCRISPLLSYADTNESVLRFIRNFSTQHHFVGFSRLSSLEFISFLSKDMTLVRDVYGKIIGWVDNPTELYNYFVNVRRLGALHFMLGLEYVEESKTFYFNLDEGRSLRPLIVKSNLLELLEWTNSVEFVYCDDKVKHCVQRGWIEYIDSNEEQSPFVNVAASFQDLTQIGGHTHMIVHGVLAMSIPLAKCFVNHNQGAKRQQAALREKSSIGMKILPSYGTTASLSLNLGQMPLVSNPVDRATGMCEVEPSGVNVMVALLAMDNNIEDSMVIKKKCVDFGVSFMSTTKVFSHALKDESYKFMNPPITAHSRSKHKHYRHLNSDGLPVIGSMMSGGDVVIGQVHLTNISHNNTQSTCVSIALPNDQCGEYRVVNIERFPEDAKVPMVVKVYLVQHNNIEVGDKINMGHGQKGTISQIMPDEDMPFICEGPMSGVSPDVILNPHCMKRNTMGMMLEMLWSKARSIDPEKVEIYDTIFMDLNIQAQDMKNTYLDNVDFLQQYEICRQVLKDVGLMSSGTERMIMGTTGQMIISDIYTGDVYMRTLPQVVRDKIRFRDRGPINELTRSTTSGKKSNGGLKIDEQLLGCIHAYSLKNLLNSLMYDNTNKFTVFYCQRCQVEAIGCTDISLYICNSCQSSQHVGRVEIPYISHLIREELYSVGFGIRFTFDEENNQESNTVDEMKLIEDFLKQTSI